MFLAEYESQYDLNGHRIFHTLVFNIGGTQCGSWKNIYVKSMGKTTSILSKVICFCLLMFLIIWINSKCQQIKGEDIGIICSYKYVSMFILALVVIVIYTVGIVLFRIRDINNVIQMKNGKKKNK